jgi:hypothetical protein
MSDTNQSHKRQATEDSPRHCPPSGPPVLDDEDEYECLPHCQLFALKALLGPDVSLDMHDLLQGAHQAFLHEGHIYQGKPWRVHIGTVQALKYSLMAKLGDNKLKKVSRPRALNKCLKLILGLSTRQRLYITGKINTKALRVTESGLGVDHGCAIIDGRIYDVNLRRPIKATEQGLRKIFTNVCRIYTFDSQ